jgi:hypothetical protein
VVVCVTSDTFWGCCAIFSCKKSIEDKLVTEEIRGIVEPGANTTYSLRIRIPTDETLHTLEFGALNNLTIQHTVSLNVRVEFAMALDGILDIPLTVVPLSEIPGVCVCVCVCVCV